MRQERAGDEWSNRDYSTRPRRIPGAAEMAALNDPWHVHHWVPRREGVHAGEQMYVQACVCGATYRGGEVVWP